MARCLNTEDAYEIFRMLAHDKYFVDKTDMIGIINARVFTMNRYVCVTKPRRFGKTSVINMLEAYYGKAHNSKGLFDNLKISKNQTYTAHLNKYNVIHLCLNELPDDGGSYENYIRLVKDSIIADIKETYPKLDDKKFRTVPELLSATRDRFIFMIDEWDYIFNHELYRKHHDDFLEFLRNLLKDRSYVALAYMTGILPIKKYSTGSALNMFKEYTMLKDPVFGEYFGFTENEVQALCKKQSVLSMDEIRSWYNGYQTKDGGCLYNPRSVVCALEDASCQSFWTRTGRMDEVLYFLKYNIAQVRDDVVKMVNHTPVRIDINREYSAGQEPPSNRKEIYSAMVIYGLLSYHDGELRIPNKELMIEFEEALGDDDFGSVAELVRNSDEVLNATLNKEGDVVASYLHNLHNSELPILRYNDENSLASRTLGSVPLGWRKLPCLSVPIPGCKNP